MRDRSRSDEGSKSQPKQASLDYHPNAVSELIDAAQFYEDRQNGLGHRFLDAVEDALFAVQTNLFIGSADELGRRKYRVKKFPYLLIYKMREEGICILAVAHTSRKPRYWESRDTEQG